MAKRPTAVVKCIFFRHRLGALLDGALHGWILRTVTNHLAGCRLCGKEINDLRYMKTLLQQALPSEADPDWSGFWAGVYRGIQDARDRASVPVRGRFRSSRRWVLGGVAAAAAAVLSVAVYETWAPLGSFEEPVVVRAANTQYPGGTMVYHTPGKMAVVWVFDE